LFARFTFHLAESSRKFPTHRERARPAGSGTRGLAAKTIGTGALAGLIALAVAALAPAVGAMAADDVAAADLAAPALMFDRPHLAAIEGATVLTYSFERSGTEAEAFTDTVKAGVTVNEDGSKDLAIRFLTGTHRVPVVDLRAYRGNPVVMVFLQNDVRTMSESLEGGFNYLRNRIRDALRDAKAEEIEAVLGERKVPAFRVAIQPFADDPNAERLGHLAHKRYEFVLSPEVPGEYLSIRATTPGEVPDAARSAKEDSLRFVVAESGTLD